MYLNPAAPRHLQPSRHLPHTSLLYRAALVLPDACCRLLWPPPALPVPRSLGVRAPHGKWSRWEGGTVFAAQTSPSPCRTRCCWRLLQGCRPARLSLKGRRSPRHQLCTPFLLFRLSVLAPLPAGGAGSAAGGSTEVSQGTAGALIRPARCWRLTAWQAPSSSLSWPGRRLKGKKKKIKKQLLGLLGGEKKIPRHVCGVYENVPRRKRRIPPRGDRRVRRRGWALAAGRRRLRAFGREGLCLPAEPRRRGRATLLPAPEGVRAALLGAAGSAGQGARAVPSLRPLSVRH